MRVRTGRCFSQKTLHGDAIAHFAEVITEMLQLANICVISVDHHSFPVLYYHHKAEITA